MVTQVWLPDAAADEPSAEDEPAAESEPADADPAPEPEPDVEPLAAEEAAEADAADPDSAADEPREDEPDAAEVDWETIEEPDLADDEPAEAEAAEPPELPALEEFRDDLELTIEDLTDEPPPDGAARADAAFELAVFETQEEDFPLLEPLRDFLLPVDIREDLACDTGIAAG